MKNTELLQNAIGMIGDDLIDDADRKPRRPRIIRWSAVACACLAVIICLSAILGGPKTPVNDFWPPVLDSSVSEMSLSATQIRKLFEVNDGGTNQYITVGAPDIKGLGLMPLPQAEYLPIYQNQYLDASEQALEDFIQKYLEKGQELSGVKSSYYEIRKRGSSAGFAGISYSTGLKGESGYNDLFFEAWCNLLSMSYSPEDPMTGARKRMKIEGEYVSILTTDTDEQICEKLSDTFAYLNAYFEKNYSQVKIVRPYSRFGLGSVYIYLYSQESTSFPENFDDHFMHRPLCSDYLFLEFQVSDSDNSWYDWGTPEDEAFLIEAAPWETMTDWENYYPIVGKARMLSLEEAEELLAKGYVFGGHSCKICMAEQKKVDFTEYDAVSFEYVHGDNGMIVPFYVFYKHLGVSEYDKTGRMQEYAKTYVPAVEIEGLEEYFDMQTEKHK